MKMLARYKLSLLVLAAGVGSAITGTLLAQADSAEQAVREMNIMRNIFGASIEEGGDRRRWRMSEPDALYLAGQGMVFTFDMPGGGFFFGFPNPMPGLPALDFDGDDFDRDLDFDMDMDIDIDDDSGIGRAEIEQIETYQRQLRELQANIEDQQRAIRERGRELRAAERDLDRTRRGLEGGDESGGAEASSDPGIAAIRTELEGLDTELRSQIESYTQLAREFQTERNTAAQARRDEQTATIFDTLCDYGTTLKSLADDEYVNLVFRDYADDQDQVYVIQRASLASCGSGTSLREGAAAYQVPN